MKTPMPHQRQALEDIVPAARRMPRLTTIMPCGTGKTMVQLWMAEALKPKTVLVLLPSLSLLRQTLHEWMAETKWQKRDVLCVCSDQTVSRRSEDEITISPEDIGYPVTSDSAEVAVFLSKKTSGVKLVFSTYHSSPLVAVGMGKNFSFDLGVFDEAHVTAGQDGGFFSFALKDENLPIKVRTFWTATPRHYDLSRVDEDTPIVYSMDDEAIYGPKVHQLTFRKAVKLGIICDYEVLVSVVTNKMLGITAIDTGEVLIKDVRVPAKIVAYHMALVQAIKRYSIRKIFSFHPRVVDAEEFANGGPQSAIHHLPRDFRVFHVNGEMTTAAREEKMNEFRHAKRALMSNVRCLTQGIDIPTVDIVAFLSKKRSLIDIVQATGRAMRRAPGKIKGYILVPLFVEQEHGETLEEAVQRSDFREVWAVLNAMREQDEALTETMSRIRIERGEGEEDDIPRDPTPDVVTVVGPRVDVEKLRDSIATICIDRLTPSWDEMYGRLLAFKKKNGHCRVPQVRGEALGYWVADQRSFYKESSLSNERIALLEQAGFEWVLRHHPAVNQLYPTLAEASQAAKKLKIKGGEEYLERHSEDPRLPSNPGSVYADEWKGIKAFLGTDKYPTWDEAAIAARKLGVVNRDEYRARYSQDKRLPVSPAEEYAEVWSLKGGWNGFLDLKPSVRTGTGKKRRRGNRETMYKTWEEAVAAAKKLGIQNRQEYLDRYPEDHHLPSNPNILYSAVWKKKGGWPGFLS